MERSRSRATRTARLEYEAAVVPGLEPFAEQEIRSLLPATVIRRSPREGRLTVLHDGPFPDFEGLNSVSAVHVVQHIQAARPTALLGHETFAAVTRLAQGILGSYPRGVFQTMRLSAAGADSRPLQRFQDELASQLALEPTTEPAHLELALRRGQAGPGWELLLRLTPRPLSARTWRICDYPGALNGTVAWVMVGLTRPSPEDLFVNVCCGSGTLLAERQRYGPVGAALGFDVSRAALDCARRNLGPYAEVGLTLADAGCLPLPDSSVSAVVGDLPFAMLQGAGETNRQLYPAVFREAARVLKPQGVFCIISTQNALVREVLAREGGKWSTQQDVSVKLPFRRGFITPSIHVLERRAP